MTQNSRIFIAIIAYVLLFTLSSTSKAQTIEPRTLDGSGNNEANPASGVSSLPFIFSPNPATSFSVFSRLDYGTEFPLRNDYFDGIGLRARPEAPNVRFISNMLSRNGQDVLEPTMLNDFAAWWLFTLHVDIAGGLQNAPRPGSPGEPDPIIVPAGDQVFDPNDTGTKTLDFNRAISTQSFGFPGTREILNAPTAFIDLDFIYQPTAADNAAVRSGSNGKMRMQQSASGELVAPTAGYIRAESGNPFALISRPDHVAITGAFPASIAIHTMLLREHNRVATELDRLPKLAKRWLGLDIKRMTPSEYDEAMFQLARTIVEAEVQAITYQEVLPTMGVKIGRYKGYDASAQPAVNLEFSSGPFRLESMASRLVPRVDAMGAPLPEGPLDNILAFIPPFSYAAFLDQGMEPILRGMLMNRAQKNDLLFDEGLRSIQPDFDTGFVGALNDLMATHIQRGRDRGVPPYVEVRKALGLTPANSFADISSDTDLRQALAFTYPDVETIDPIIGMLAEDRVRGSIFGPTALKLFQQQFSVTRDTDRFWHQNRLAKNFELRLAMCCVGIKVQRKRGQWVLKRTLADLIRDTTDVGVRGDVVRINRRTKALIAQ